ETLSFSIGDMSAKGLGGTSSLATAKGEAIEEAEVGEDGSVDENGFREDTKGLDEAINITLNGTNIAFEAGDTVEKVVDKINNASTGVTASLGEDKILTLSSLSDFTAEGEGLAVLGFEGG